MVKSYDFGEHTGFPAGAYVQLSDYEQLEKELAESKKLVNELGTDCVQLQQTINCLDGVKAELDAANKKSQEWETFSREQMRNSCLHADEMDAANKRYDDLNKSLTAELRDPSGTIWEYAAKLEKERDEYKNVADTLDNLQARQRDEIAELKARVAELQAIADEINWFRESKYSVQKQLEEARKEISRLTQSNDAMQKEFLLIKDEYYQDRPMGECAKKMLARAESAIQKESK